MKEIFSMIINMKYLLLATSHREQNLMPWIRERIDGKHPRVIKNRMGTFCHRKGNTNWPNYTFKTFTFTFKSVKNIFCLIITFIYHSLLVGWNQWKEYHYSGYFIFCWYYVNIFWRWWFWFQRNPISIRITTAGT